MQRVARAKRRPPGSILEARRARAARLPPARPGEVLPRRDHALRLVYAATAGYVLMSLGWAALGAGTPDGPSHPAAAALPGGVAGFLVGRAQARWMWRGEVPRHLWAPHCAVGWAAGSALLAALDARYSTLYGHGYHGLQYEFLYELFLVLCGAVAGALAGVQQARVLRALGVDRGWWIAASTLATALGWSFWAILSVE